jgi:hypothetical protein
VQKGKEKKERKENKEKEKNSTKKRNPFEVTRKKNEEENPTRME